MIGSERQLIQGSDLAANARASFVFGPFAQGERVRGFYLYFCLANVATGELDPAPGPDLAVEILRNRPNAPTTELGFPVATDLSSPSLSGVTLPFGGTELTAAGMVMAQRDYYIPLMLEADEEHRVVCISVTNFSDAEANCVVCLEREWPK